MNGVNVGVAIGNGNCVARRLQDTPANKMKKIWLEARAISKASSNITLKIIDESEMKKLGMGSLLCLQDPSNLPI